MKRSGKIKVLFIWNGMTHYFNLITSKINAHPDVEIIYLSPEKSGSSIGDGVYQTQEGINFNYYFLPEKRSEEYDSLCFEGLYDFLVKHKPDIILMSESHVRSVMFDRQLNDLIKDNSIGVVLKSIPFMVKRYDEELTECRKKLALAPLP